ncbi:hypothetical protein C5167_013155 [Papaver somniferum]|uniref:Transmembrane protein 50A n=1 Tax=Papaver somniferum TaxID=3469 RepID=A0A4Y7J3R4_PAPSO|nr:hypothetical protein C5167_013155 [Papaver somniferum]
MDPGELWAIFGPGFAGAVFGAGWWFWVDAVVCSAVAVSFVHYLPGIFASFAALMFNCVRKEDIDYSPYEEGEWRCIMSLSFDMRWSLALDFLPEGFFASDSHLLACFQLKINIPYADVQIEALALLCIRCFLRIPGSIGRSIDTRCACGNWPLCLDRHGWCLAVCFRLDQWPRVLDVAYRVTGTNCSKF